MTPAASRELVFVAECYAPRHGRCVHLSGGGAVQSTADARRSAAPGRRFDYILFGWGCGSLSRSASIVEGAMSATAPSRSPASRCWITSAALITATAFSSLAAIAAVAVTVSHANPPAGVARDVGTPDSSASQVEDSRAEISRGRLRRIARDTRGARAAGVTVTHVPRNPAGLCRRARHGRVDGWRSGDGTPSADTESQAGCSRRRRGRQELSLIHI